MKLEIVPFLSWAACGNSNHQYAEEWHEPCYGQQKEEVCTSLAIIQQFVLWSCHLSMHCCHLSIIPSLCQHNSLFLSPNLILLILYLYLKLCMYCFSNYIKLLLFFPLIISYPFLSRCCLYDWSTTWNQNICQWNSEASFGICTSLMVDCIAFCCLFSS
jgi:hypothetical protein